MSKSESQSRLPPLNQAQSVAQPINEDEEYEDEDGWEGDERENDLEELKEGGEEEKKNSGLPAKSHGASRTSKDN